MTKPSASATASGGDVIATHTMDAKEHQSVVVVDDTGHIVGSKDTYVLVVPNQVHVATANNPAWDLFNADPVLKVRVLSVRQIPDILTPVAGVVISWLLERTTAVGTGGTVLTPAKANTATTLDADITARSKPAGGATPGVDLFPFQLSSEETLAATQMVASLGGLELVPEELRRSGYGYLLGQNEGIRVTQVTSSAVGNTAWVVVFTVE